MHNPVMLPEDIARFRRLIRMRHLHEDTKTRDRSRLSKRIVLLHEVIAAGLDALDHIGRRSERQ